MVSERHESVSEGHDGRVEMEGFRERWRLDWGDSVGWQWVRGGKGGIGGGMSAGSGMAAPAAFGGGSVLV